MIKTAEKLSKIIQLVDEFDTFGKLDRDMSLFSVAIGTLRKDRSLAADILKIAGNDSDGLGAIALSRILSEDYLHLLYLNANQEDLAENIENFNTHPHIEHYSSIRAMKEWGFDFSGQDAERVIKATTNAFAAYKDRFQRRKPKEGGFDPDDYYRTWTKLSLNDLIKNSGLSSTTAGKKRLKFITETYDNASSVVHHNSFVVWLLANQGAAIFSGEYPELALTVSVIVFNQMVDLVLEIAQPRIGEEQRAQYLNRLADML